MLKKGMFVIIFGAFMFSQMVYASTSTFTVNVSGDSIGGEEPMGEIVEGQLFVPLRLVAEVAHEKVSWDEKNKVVALGDSKETAIYHKLGTSYVVNGYTDEKIDMGACSYIKNNQMMMPKNFFSEAMLFRVYWDPENNVLDIYTSPGEDPNYRGTPVDIWD